METETKVNSRRVDCCFGKRHKGTPGKKRIQDESATLKSPSKAPSYTQESHNRRKVLGKHPRVIKYRTELNPKGKLYP